MKHIIYIMAGCLIAHVSIAVAGARSAMRIIPEVYPSLKEAIRSKQYDNVLLWQRLQKPARGDTDEQFRRGVRDFVKSDAEIRALRQIALGLEPGSQMDVEALQQLAQIQDEEMRLAKMWQDRYMFGFGRSGWPVFERPKGSIAANIQALDQARLALAHAIKHDWSILDQKVRAGDYRSMPMGTLLGISARRKIAQRAFDRTTNPLVRRELGEALDLTPDQTVDAIRRKALAEKANAERERARWLANWRAKNENSK